MKSGSNLKEVDQGGRSKPSVKVMVVVFRKLQKKLFSGKPILRFCAAPFIFTFVVFFDCAVYLVSGLATKAAMPSPKSLTIL